MAAAQQQDAIALLKADHREVEQLFSRFEKLGDRAGKSKHDVVKKITTLLAVHATAEEEILYPAARQAAGELEDLTLESLEEHHLVKLTLAELEHMSPSDERFTAKVTVLIENVRHHVEEEEGELFPQLRSIMSRQELRDLGQALVAAKKTAPKRPHPMAPDTPPGNVIAGALVAPVDAARERISDVVEATGRAVRGRITADR